MGKFNVEFRITHSAHLKKNALRRKPSKPLERGKLACPAGLRQSSAAEEFLSRKERKDRKEIIGVTLAAEASIKL